MRIKIKIHLYYKKIFIFLTFTIFLFGLPFVVPQDIFCQNIGFKYLKNYTPDEYDGQDQNWSILQDKRGIIYVANQSGLLQFDGVSWRLISISNDSVRSMAIDDSGTIYIGGENEIGFIAQDSKGALKYDTLLDHLADMNKKFSIVLRTHATKDGIYFMTSKFLFWWDPKSHRMKVFKPRYTFGSSFICEGKLFIHQKKVGLMHIKNDSLKLLPGGETFKAVQIDMLTPYDTNKLLIGTRSHGFYIFDMITKEKNPFPTDVDNYIKEKELSHGIRLSPSFTKTVEFALATLQGGLIIIDSHGKVKTIFTKGYGLQDDDVRYVFEDFQGNLWLGLNSGISKIEYFSPFSVFDDRANLPGRILSVIKHQNQLYAGTNSGLYFYTLSDKFTTVRGIPGMCWSLLSIGDSLYVATTTYGVFQVGNKNKNSIEEVRRIIENPSYVLLQSQKVPKRIWVGTDHGLVSLYPKSVKYQWEEEYRFEAITEGIRTIVENKKGNLWLGTLTKGVLKVDFPRDGQINNPIVTRYDTSHGLPPGKINVYMALGNVIFTTGKGIYQFYEPKKTFTASSILGDEFTDNSKGVFRIVEDKKNKNIWFYSKYQNYQLIPKTDGTYVLNKIPSLRSLHAQVNDIYPDSDGDTVWFAGNEGLIRYDTTVKRDYEHVFNTLIRKVLVNEKLIYNGNKIDNDSESKRFFLSIPYKNRKLSFEFAAPFFEAETETQYQCFLEGYDNNWSAWNKNAKRNYIYLDSGLYTFRVRAKNVYEHTSSEDVFRFKILPPWYKTWWAFLFYGIGFFLLMFLVVKWRSNKLQREKQKLEHTIKQRTKEIQEKNKQLKDQSDKLKEMDKVKSRFFANISHEFRTPLTLIMGPMEQMLSDSQDKKQKKKLGMMLRNSQRLLTLINQLLDLSRFDSGKMKLQAACLDIVPFLKGIFSSFQFAAQKNQLALEFHTEKERIILYFDAHKMEEVMYNLLINALKFTLPGGKIIVSVSIDHLEQQDQKDHPQKGSSPTDFVKISVSDTGIGIPKEQLAHIFDRFYQAEGLKEKAFKGTGIGLALTKEIILLHHGKIDVHSQEGIGTEFVILIPIGHKHLKPHEIAASPERSSTIKKVNDLEPLYLIPYDDVEAEKDMAHEDKTEEQEKNVILVVEDHADVRKYICDPLKPSYTVVESADGKEGTAKAKEIIPDLIVSDIMMPEVDGYELCQQLKKDIRTSHIPIILLTAKASEESIIQGLETGADDYITKPFNTKILMTRIKNLIDLRSHLQQKIQKQMLLQPVEIAVSSMDQEFIKELQAMIEKNLSDPEFNVEALSKKLYMDRATLYRKITALTGESPTEFIRSYRLKRAAQLLRDKFGNVSQVSLEVGFSNMAYFAKCFKEKFHQLPSSYQASESK
jgi:signal transduction histidine kinase/DNA-binding response OmpR family regulator/ligand-binding sensor domain-containing protein